MGYRHTVSPLRLNALCFGRMLCVCGGYKESLELERLQAGNWATECPPIYRRYGQAASSSPAILHAATDLADFWVSASHQSWSGSDPWLRIHRHFVSCRLPAAATPQGSYWRPLLRSRCTPRLRHLRKVPLHPTPIPRVRDHRHVTCLNRCSRPEDGGQKEFAGSGEISTSCLDLHFAVIAG